MEIDSRFWKIHKKSWKLKGTLLRNGTVPFIQHFNTRICYVIRSNFGVLHIFLYCDWNLVLGFQRQDPAGALCTRRELMASVHISSCHKACKKSMEVMEKSWKKYRNLVDTPCVENYFPRLWGTCISYAIFIYWDGVLFFETISFTSVQRKIKEGLLCIRNPI